MTEAKYDVDRGAAIWNRRMSQADGQDVALSMVQVLREQAQGVEHPDGWQSETISRVYQPDGDPVWYAVAGNVLIEMFKDFEAQIAEAKARGDEVPAP